MNEGMNEGWIKLYRKLEDSPVFNYQNPYMLKVFIKCLISASHKPHKIIYCGEERILMPGEFVYGRESWSKKLGIPKSTLRNLILKLQNWDIIEDKQKDSEKDKRMSTIFKVKNWEIYQDEDKQVDKKLDKKEDKHRTSVGQAQDTNNNDKNDKNEKKLTTHEEFFQTILDTYNLTNETHLRAIGQQTKDNIVYRLEFHSEKDILEAIKYQPYCKNEFLKDIGFDVLFRKYNRAREEVDYIGVILKDTTEIRSKYGA